jgi:anti-anti-sigma regulatory factor
MLRITISTSEGRPVLNLEGRISSESLDDLRSIVESWCEKPQAESPPALDLTGVSWIDREGVRLLQRLIDRGAGVQRASPFIMQLLGSD